VNVLIIGSGGREHALAWRLAHSTRVDEIFVALGNGGTAWDGHEGDPHSIYAPSSTNLGIAELDFPALIQAAKQHDVKLVVVGPEAPLAAGIVDAFAGSGIPIFGPTREAARLEGSKAFSKTLMRESGVPTADFEVVHDLGAALEWLEHPTFDTSSGLVVKADGLAAGKGVIVCDTLQDARDAVGEMFSGAFGNAGQTVLLEERLSGPEVSVLAFCDGETVALMPPARDHKRIFDGDRGPNTGGMGAFCPVLDLEPDFLENVRVTVLEPIMHAMKSRGTPYQGVLYAGIMLTPRGLRVLEFNARFGDPETQAILPLLESDLSEILEACALGKLAQIAPNIRWRSGACVTVVVASRGYPASAEKGVQIVLDANLETPSRTVFHAGTTVQDGQLATNGGRVLAVTAWAQNFDAARALAYEGLSGVQFDGMQFRTDIGLT
jgi:phosphoribosylamine---glycine ligase